MPDPKNTLRKAHPEKHSNRECPENPRRTGISVGGVGEVILVGIAVKGDASVVGVGVKVGRGVQTFCSPPQQEGVEDCGTPWFPTGVPKGDARGSSWGPFIVVAGRWRSAGGDT